MRIFFSTWAFLTQRGREMHTWEKVLLVLFPSAIVVGFFFIFLRRCCRFKKPADFPATPEIDRLRLPYNYSRKGRASYHLHESSRKHKWPNNIVWRNGFFSWDDNPSLVSEAVENGWSIFALIGFPSFPSSRKWGLCRAQDQELESDAETTWEIGSSSSDYMQKIRLNSRMKRSNNDGLLWVSCVRTSLPLPGPKLGDSSFPQEAYLEITILSNGEEEVVSGIQKSFSDRTRGISEAAMKGQFDGRVYHQHVKSSRKVEESKFVIHEEGKDIRGEVKSSVTRSGGKVISLGLSGPSAPPFRYPGSYPGSIGFNSDGLVYLDGIVENKTRQIAAWGATNTVIGLGFDPAQRRVFFTVDSVLVHTVNCKSEAFSCPLFPTLAANFNATVLVNLGQSPFKYAPANAQRTTDPCFVRPSLRNAAGSVSGLGYDDSREFFSIGRIDSQWRNRSSTTNKVVGDGDEMDSEADLFEIILDDATIKR